jgi:hypothetical protein
LVLFSCREYTTNQNIISGTALRQAQFAVTRDDDIKGDRDLVEHLDSHGIAVLTVQHFLDRLDAGEV